MILARTPLRMSFCGGGTDLADFYKVYGGCVISTSITMYNYVGIKSYYKPDKISLRYSDNEVVTDASEINHSIFRSAFTKYNLKGVEIINASDLPAGRGLASSSSFSVGLINVLNAYSNHYLNKYELSEGAYELEHDLVGIKCGKQDQYASAFGGLNMFKFNPDESVSVYPVILKSDVLRELEDNIVLYYTGVTHDNKVLLSERDAEHKDNKKLDSLIRMAELAEYMYASLQSNDLQSFGQLLNENWECKKNSSSTISTPMINELYDKALHNGALGGKLLGSGQGGYMMFYCPKSRQSDLDKALNLTKLNIKFDTEGSKLFRI